MHYALIFNVSFLFLVLFVLSFLIEENTKKIQLLHFILFILFLTNLFSADFHFETLNLFENISNKFNSNFSLTNLNWNYYYDIDLFTYFSIFFSIFFLSFLFLGYCDQFLLKENKDFEFSWLICLFFLTSIFMLISVQLIEIFICLECMSFCSYILVSLERSNKLSAMSGIRYLIISSIPSCLLILGIIYIYENYGTFSKANLELFLQFYNDSSPSFDMLKNDLTFNQNIKVSNLQNLEDFLMSIKDSALFYETINLSEKNIRMYDILNELTDSLWKLLLILKDYENNKTLNLPQNFSHLENDFVNYFENIFRPSANGILDAIEYFKNLSDEKKDLFTNIDYLDYRKNLESLEVLGEIVPTFDLNRPNRVNSVDYGFKLLNANLDLDQDIIEFTRNLNIIENFMDKSINFWNDKGILNILEYRLRYDYGQVLNDKFNLFSKNLFLSEIFSNNLYQNSLTTNRCKRLDLIGEFTSLYYTFKVLNLEFFKKENSFLNLEALDYIFIENSNWWTNFVKKDFLTNSNNILNIQQKDFSFDLNSLFENVEELVNFNFLSNKYFFMSLNIALLLIIINLSFKLTAAPFHVWAPSVYNNAATASVSFLAIFSKIILFLFAIKLFSTTFYDLKLYWSYIFFVISILSIIMGMIGAFGEKFLKKFFVYSSMTDVGFILLGLSFYSFEISKNLINYIFVYNLSSMIIWFTLLYFRRQTKFLVNLQYILAGDAILTLIFALNIFSLAGIPPFGGFFIKLDILNYLILSANYGVGFFILLLTVFNFFYYLRLIKIVYFERKNFSIINNNIEPYKLFIFAFVINIICGYELFMQNSYIYILQYITQSLF